ncbi:MAG: MFS transporter [Candidatus Eisenbacteria bacterium]
MSLAPPSSRSPEPRSAIPGFRARLFGYSMYDFANSAFATTILAVLYNQYYAREIAADVRLWGHPVPGATLWSAWVSACMIVVVAAAPFLGVLADRRGRRIRWLAGFWIPGVICTALLYFPERGDWLWGGAIFALAYFAFSATAIFYNALLPEVAPPAQLGRVSGIAWGIGYLGGALLLVVNLLMLQKPAWLGFPAGSLRIQDCFASVAVWWFVFTLPTLWIFRYEGRQAGAGTADSLIRETRESLAQVRRTFGHLVRQANLRRFFVAYLLYNDGVQTVVTMASIFGSAELGMEPGQLVLYFLLIQGTAFVGSIALGWLADRIGHRETLITAVVAWAILTSWAAGVGIFGNALREYWILGGIAGLFLGGIQSCSRSMIASWIPPRRESEFFGFFSIMTRVASIFGPLLYGGLLWATGSLRWAILAVTAFFIAGGIVLYGVRTDRIPDERADLAR